jgi:hypothetical protein
MADFNRRRANEEEGGRPYKKIRIEVSFDKNITGVVPHKPDINLQVSITLPSHPIVEEGEIVEEVEMMIDVVDDNTPTTQSVNPTSTMKNFIVGLIPFVTHRVLVFGVLGYICGTA